MRTDPVRLAHRTACAACSSKCLRMERALVDGYRVRNGEPVTIAAGALLCRNCACWAEEGTPPTPEPRRTITDEEMDWMRAKLSGEDVAMPESLRWAA